MKLHLTVLGTPKPKQSFRVRAYKVGEKTIATKYQTKEVKDMERNFAWDVKSQLPDGFIPFDEPLRMECLFVFPIPKSMSKKNRMLIQAGGTVYKDTKPDVTDNLTKGISDAMEGIVYINDSRIVEYTGKKIYGDRPRVEVWIEPIEPEQPPSELTLL